MDNFIEKIKKLGYVISIPTIIAIAIYYVDKEVSIRDKEIAFLNRQIQSTSSSYTWGELDAQGKIHQLELKKINQEIEKKRKELILTRNDRDKYKKNLDDLQVTLYKKENLLQKIRNIIYSKGNIGCSYRIMKLKLAIESSHPSNYRKLLCDIPLESIDNIKEYLSKIKKYTREAQRDLIDALQTYDEITNSYKIAENISLLINQYDIKSIAFVSNLKVTQKDDVKNEVVIALNLTKLCASLHLYRSLVNFDKNKDLEFIDQFLFDDFIDNVQSISYEGIYNKERNILNFLKSSNIDGLVIFHETGDDLMVEFVTTSNKKIPFSKYVLSIEKKQFNALSYWQERYIARVEELTSNMLIDLETLNMFSN